MKLGELSRIAGRLVLGIGNIPNVSMLEAKFSRLPFSQSVYNRRGHKISRWVLLIK